DRWKHGGAKLVHWTLGILLNVWGTVVMLIANSWLTYMMTPPRDITATTDPSSIKLWHAIANATWMPINVHRLIANVVFGGAIVAAYASYRFLAAKTDEERAHYDWMGYVGNFIAISALIVLPSAGYWLGREVYHSDQTVGIQGRLAPPVVGRPGRDERQEHRREPDDPHHVPVVPSVPSRQHPAGRAVGEERDHHPGSDVRPRGRRGAVLRHPRLFRRGHRPDRLQRVSSPRRAGLHRGRDRDRRADGTRRTVAGRDPVGQDAAALAVRAVHPGGHVHVDHGAHGVRALRH